MELTQNKSNTIEYFNLHTSIYPIVIIIFVSLQPCKVTAHWHKGTTYMVKFEDHVISRDRQLEEK